MKQTRKPGGGRKSDSTAGPAAHFNSRISPEVRERLVQEAKRNDRTLSKEIEERIKASFDSPDLRAMIKEAVKEAVAEAFNERFDVNI